MKTCQCASMSPGISTRPSALITFTSELTVMGLAEIRSMMLPRTSTLEAVESVALLPSKIRTFSKSVEPALICGAEGVSPGTSMS